MRFRLCPTREQETVLLSHCGHARYVWNLGLEQRLCYRKESGPTPGWAEQCRQLTEARAAEPWLAEGPQGVQQQALRDLDQGWRNFFGGTHQRPTWRKKGQHEGFRVVGKDVRTRVLNRKWVEVNIPKLGVLGNFVAVLVIPFVGNLSDKVGRKPVFIVGALSSGAT